MDENDELLPIVDPEGNVIGSAQRCVCHDGKSMLLHPVCHLHIFNSKGDLLLQLRSKHKRIQPDKWDTAVGGHVDFGENILLSLCREAKEEAGLDISEVEIIPLKNYIFQSPVERELIYSFATIAPEGYKPEISEPNDIDEFRFWNIEDIQSNLGESIFTPNFEDEFKMVVFFHMKSMLNNLI